MQLRERAGIEFLGQYRSQGRSKKLHEALHAFSRAVEVPAQDYFLYKWVTTLLGYRLIPDEENRSVTAAEWVETALLTYGCGIHERATARVPSGGRVPGCTCTGVPSTSKVRNATGEHTDSEGGSFGSALGSGSSVSSLRDDHGRKSGGRVASAVPSSEIGRRDEESHRLAIRSVYHSLGASKGRSRPLEFSEVVEHHIHGDSFSGLPLLGHNRDNLDKGLRLAERIRNKERGFDPYLFGRRVQPGKSGPKTRLVWMAALPTTIVGLAFSKPVQEALARTRPYTWGLRHAEQGAIISEMAGRFRYVYSIDWSQFDATVPPWLIKDIFQAIRSKLDLTDAESDLYWRYVNDFIHTRIVIPSGEVVQVHKGIPSGSAFTSLIGSMVNVYLTNYVWYRLTGHTVDHTQMQVMGDDVIVAANERVQLADAARVAAELGFKLNAQKSVIISTNAMEDGVHFVGHYWTHGRPRRPVREIIQRMAFPERHSKQTLVRSLTRLGGYALTTVDGLQILLQLYDQDDIVSAVCQYLYELRSNGAEIQFRAQDLPGDWRRRVLVEGEKMPDLGGRSGPHTLLYASIS